ncbi:hypothetical protein BDV33DRAFT_185268 [Aspergillus novoparasiticus]|uniref:Uncharacterized protein n=1 Tax=Aspergillus novoparasiticus TaxID=986946 RepID=A0A5N6E6I5_9EURO|nr:hypothetical protein BDV33DRAFT_185268 [Aspergillus novoparasiticus]
MSTPDPPPVSIIPLLSDKVKDCAREAWKEARPVAESLPKPKRSTIARFFATDACDAPINAAISEYSIKTRLYQTSRCLPREISTYKRGGLVVFPGEAAVGQTFTIMIPLHICGEVTIEGLVLDTDHYYHIARECKIDVPEGAKLSVLVISDFT